MSARTGSSIVSGIFARHGLWCGKHQSSSNGAGFGGRYKTYEIVELKPWLHRHFGIAGAELHRPTAAQLRSFMQEVKRLVPNDRPIVCKLGVMFFHLWRPFNPYKIYVKRDLDCAVEASFARSKWGKRTVFMNKDEIRDAIEKRFAMMDMLHAKYGGKMVHVDRIIAGDYDEIQAAVEYAGLTFDENAVTGILEPKKWHFHEK